MKAGTSYQDRRPTKATLRTICGSIRRARCPLSSTIVSVFSDSRAILDYLDVRFPGWGLQIGAPAHDIDEADRLFEALYAIPFRELSYGSPKLRRVGAFMNAKRVNNLLRRQRENPQLAEIYAEKIADIEGFSARALDAHHVCNLRMGVENSLDRLNEALADRRFLAGADYSMADVVWTVGVAQVDHAGYDAARRPPGVEGLVC